MLTDRGAHPRVDVGRGAQLEADPAIAHERREPPEMLVPLLTRDVVDDADAVEQRAGHVHCHQLSAG